MATFLLATARLLRIIYSWTPAMQFRSGSSVDHHWRLSAMDDGTHHGQINDLVIQDDNGTGIHYARCMLQNTQASQLTPQRIPGGMKW